MKINNNDELTILEENVTRDENYRRRTKYLCITSATIFVSISFGTILFITYSDNIQFDKYLLNLTLLTSTSLSLFSLMISFCV